MPDDIDRLITVAAAEETYADVLGALDAAGYGGTVHDLGGDCIVIYVPLDDTYGPYLTIASQTGSLPTDRSDVAEWVVQRYDLDEGTQEQAIWQYPAGPGTALVEALVADAGL